MIYVLDDVFVGAAGYARVARQMSFGDLVPSPVVTFHGMCHYPGAALLRAVQQHWPELTLTHSFLRRSPKGQDEPNFIHTDLDMGQWSGLYYLTEHPREDDGTIFWQHTATSFRHSWAFDPEKQQAEWLAWRDHSQWREWARVDAKFNRLVVFPSYLFHSRAIFENYGEGDDARLIQILFGQGLLPDVEVHQVCVLAPQAQS